MPTVGDPVPSGFNWDEWLGPAPARVYKERYYHPWDWRGWLAFGSGPIGDFGCHDLNLPFRALKLDYPATIEVDAELMGLPTYPKDAHIKFEFAQRGPLVPVTVNWYDGDLARGKRDTSFLPPAIAAHFGDRIPEGLLIIGEKGFTYGGHWDGSEYIMLNGEEKLAGILNHKATKDIAETLPRSPGHMKEWVEACLGGAPVFSNFETGGHLTEIGLSGVVAARVGKKLEWDGSGMRAKNAPEAEQYIRGKYRTDWI
jgi:predicted dehydrogenase